MTNYRSPGLSSTPRQLLLAALCLLAPVATGCSDPSRDVSNDPNYGNFSTVTGRWKTKTPLMIVEYQTRLFLWTSQRDVGGVYKLLATVPPGTELSVEHLMLHPSFEANTMSETGSLVSGPYAGKTLDLDPDLFARNAITSWSGSPTVQLPRTWQVNPDQLEK
jgi:hypothetical protein